MIDINLGQKIYTTKTILSIKLMAGLACVALLINLYYQTFNDPEYTKYLVQNFSQFMAFHLKYPYDILSYIFFIFVPSIYYSFIRGASFFENGIIINRGFPFYNESILYKNVLSYEIIHSKMMIAIRLKTGKEIIFGVSDLDRVLSIFDQHDVSGDLKAQNKIKFSIHSLITVFFFLMGLSVAIGQSSLDLSRYLFR